VLLQKSGFSGVLGFFAMILLLQIFSWFWQWKKNWKLVNIWRCYDAYRKVCQHFLGHPV